MEGAFSSEHVSTIARYSLRSRCLYSNRVHVSRLSSPDSCRKSRKGIAGSNPVVSPTRRRYQQRTLAVIEEMPVVTWHVSYYNIVCDFKIKNQLKNQIYTYLFSLQYFDFAHLVFPPFCSFYGISCRYLFREHPTFMLNIVFFPCTNLGYTNTCGDTLCRRTDNRVVRYSRLRMRIYQIQVHFEMQFAKRRKLFSESRSLALSR